MAVYITGDTHGDFRDVTRFAVRMSLDRDDIIVILGDVGLNFYLDRRDYWGKLKLGMTAPTYFCIHGNHECRTKHIKGYQTKEWNGGLVDYEPGYPNILFAHDGEVYNLPSKDGTTHKVIVCGGAYSVDKEYRIERGIPWFKDEQPDDETKKKVEDKLESLNWEVDDVFTHTAPKNFEPTELFLPSIDQSKVDKTTENWLQSIYDQIKYNGTWYFGHYHGDKHINDKMIMLFNSFEML